jgi:hypothetical protein
MRKVKIFLIDSNLEEFPEWFYDFEMEMCREKSDMVYDVYLRRKGSIVERITVN